MAKTGRGVLKPGVAKREVWAWAMFDFANSGYTTVVITAVFNAYFVATVAGNTPWATLAWTSALALSYALIMLTAPVLGAYADAHGARKRLLAYSTFGCVAGTAALSLVGPGELGLAVALIVASNFCFGSGENLIAAFLPELARERALGRISGLGWGLGYVGGIATLGACLAYVTHAQGLGQGASVFVPVTMLITAGLFALASLPTFLFLKERGVARAGPPRRAYRQVLDSLRRARAYPDLARFLGCIVAYQAGIQAVIALAAVYAQQAMGFTTGQSIVLILVVNVMAALGALGFGPVQDRIGHKAAMAWTLAGWLLTIVLAWQASGSELFWLAANLAGLCLGAAQSAGRALVGYLSPPARRGEFFGLWGMAVKLAAILGPVTYGAAVWLGGGEHRSAMLILALFFIVGLVLLARVDIRRGRRGALRGEKKLEIGVAGTARLG